jgi:hypothetical protein
MEEQWSSIQLFCPNRNRKFQTKEETGFKKDAHIHQI